jgi:hypothetical protein
MLPGIEMNYCTAAPIYTATIETYTKTKYTNICMYYYKNCQLYVLLSYFSLFPSHFHLLLCYPRIISFEITTDSYVNCQP